MKPHVLQIWQSVPSFYRGASKALGDGRDLATPLHNTPSHLLLEVKQGEKASPGLRPGQNAS